MPIITVNDYTWRQTPELIIITMPIKGKPTKIDVFIIDNYMKISYPPFILELFLFENITEEESECTLGELSAVFTLKKTETGREWPILIHENLTKEKKHEYRSKAMERTQLLAEIKAKKQNEKQQELQRQAVRKQIELDTAVYNKIECIRDSHRREAMKDFENWREHAEKPIFTNVKSTIQSNRKAYSAPVQWYSSKSKSDTPYEIDTIKNLNDLKTIKDSNSQVNNEIKLNDININSTNESDDTKNSSPNKSLALIQTLNETYNVKIEQLINSQKENDNNRRKKIIDKLLTEKCHSYKHSIFENTNNNTPMPRQNGIINIKFSERIFPTPARESHHLEEQEWLEKQAEARRKCGFVSEDLRPEEQDPQWLKDKGDEFFKAGNYIAAVSAYTHGIKLSDKMTSLYSNRSAAQYALGNYRRCAEDCSKALELMIPKCEGNRESRARCHARLGATLCKLSAPQHGIPELEEALKLSPDNETIKSDLNEARKFFEMDN